MLSQNKIGTNFPLNLLLSDKKVSGIYKVFENKPLVKVKLSKTQISRIMQSERFLGRLLEPLMKVGLPLMRNVLAP